MSLDVHFSSAKQDWRTPPELFAEWHQRFRFTLDVAADRQNALCPVYFSVETNALIRDWFDYPCSCLHELQADATSDPSVFRSQIGQTQRSNLMVSGVHSHQSVSKSTAKTITNSSKGKSRKIASSTQSSRSYVETPSLANRQQSPSCSAVTLSLDTSIVETMPTLLGQPVCLLQNNRQAGTRSCNSVKRSTMSGYGALEYGASMFEMQPDKTKTYGYCPHCGISGTPAVCWMNSPYERGVQSAFVKKAVEQTNFGVVTVALLPARTDTRLFHSAIWHANTRQPYPWVSELHFLKGRIRFVGAPASAPFPSMIVVFGKLP